MKKSVKFVTPTKLSLLDITSMGDSEKRDDPSKIGQFCSGLKYSIALLLRDNVDISIEIIGEEEDWGGGWYEPFTTTYTFNTYIDSDHKKEKELISIIENVDYHGGSPMNQHDMREPSSSPASVIHKTGYALGLGYNWSMWMSFRELYSNMLDEGGYYTEEDVDIEEGTIIRLSFDESNEFYGVWENKHLYINEKKPLHIIKENSVEALENPEGWLRIYKQNILVYEDKKKPSKYAWNITFGQIDERRILSDVYQIEGNIISYIRNTENEEFLREIITSDFTCKDNEFLSNRSEYGTSSDLIHDIASEVYEKHGQVSSYHWLLDTIKKRKDCRIAGKKMTTVEDDIWNYSSTVSVESIPVCDVKLPVEGSTQEISPLQIKISKYYNFNLDVDYKKAKLKNAKVVADKYDNCIIIDEEFDVKRDMSELLVEYVSLTKKGNVVRELSNYILKLIQK